MKSKNELFLDAVDYLIDEGLAANQGDVALKAGLGPNLISRVRNGYVKCVSDDSIRALAFKFNLNMDYFRGKSDYITRYDQLNAKADRDLEEAKRLLNKDTLPPAPKPQTEIPDFVQRLFDEAVRMQTRNELLERQCEKLIGELRDSKDKNESFLQELRKSKEFNDTLVAELKISRTQNETLITELRESKKQSNALSTKLEAAINSLEMLTQLYSSSKPSEMFPLYVNEDDGTLKFEIPQGLIRGSYRITDNIAKQAAKVFKQTDNK